MLKNFTRPSGTYSYNTPSSIDVLWREAITGQNYAQLPGVSIHDVFTVTTQGVRAFNHSAFMYERIKEGQPNKILMAWPTHDTGEQSSGFHTVGSISEDDGVTWSSMVTICPQMDVMRDATTTIIDGRLNYSSDFIEVDGTCYLLVRVADRVGGIGGTDVGVGIMVVPFNDDSNTFGTPLWIYNYTNNLVAPTPITGYPAYSFASSSLIKGVYREACQVGKWFANGIPLKLTKWNGTDDLSEMWCDRLPKPNNSIIYIHKNTVTTPTPKVKFAEVSFDLKTKSAPWQTNMPDGDNPSRSVMKRINNVLVYIGTPRYYESVNRDPLIIAFGTLYGSGIEFKISNTYKLYYTNPTPALKFAGVAKLKGPQYPDIVLSSTGKVLVSFSFNKEDMKCARFDMPTIN